MQAKAFGLGGGSSEPAEQEGCSMSSSLILLWLEILAQLSVPKG